MPDDEPISEAPIDWAFDKQLGMETCKDFALHVDILLDFNRMELDQQNFEMLYNPSDLALGLLESGHCCAAFCFCFLSTDWTLAVKLMFGGPNQL